MDLKIKLSDVIDALEKQGDESFAYLDKRTGKFLVVAPTEFEAAEDNEPLEAYPAWLREAVKAAKDILNDKENYFELPSQFDIYEYGMMEKFAHSIKDNKISRVLQVSLQGPGAFGRFRDILDIFELKDDWYAFRSEAYRCIASEWCKKNNIRFEDK